jgi:hypothetical protein
MAKPAGFDGYLRRMILGKRIWERIAEIRIYP